MGAEGLPARKRSLGVLGVLSVIALLALVVGTCMFVFALWRRSAAIRAREEGKLQPLRETGFEPDTRISDLEAYRLRVWGKVGRELSLTFDEVKALGMSETDAPLHCVLGWTNYRDWRGTPIRNVLAPAQPHGAYITIRDDRDFSASLSTEYVDTGQPMLAWEANGEPLAREHGWPLRVVAPGKFGYKWVKWVTEIEVHDRGYEGTYESGGFSLDGDADGPRTEAERKGLQ